MDRNTGRSTKVITTQSDMDYDLKTEIGYIIKEKRGNSHFFYHWFMDSWGAKKRYIRKSDVEKFREDLKKKRRELRKIKRRDSYLERKKAKTWTTMTAYDMGSILEYKLEHGYSLVRRINI